MKLYKIEEDILTAFEDLFPELKERLLSVAKKAKNIDREFTGSGAYVSFVFQDATHLSNKDLKNERFNSLSIKSDELEFNAPVSVKFDKHGILDYIEIEMGMKKKTYPENYKLVVENPNIIIDYKIY